MKILRDPDTKTALFVVLGLSVLAVGITAWLANDMVGWTALLCLVFCSVFVLDADRRRARVQALTEEIDRVLHGDDTLRFDTYKEGELAVLQSELHKMTARLRQQRQQLKADKVYLADALADISHQIRTPLTSLNLLMSFLEDDRLSPSLRQTYAAEAVMLLDRIEQLVNVLLKMSRLDAGTAVFAAEAISLQKLIFRAAQPLQIAMELREIKLNVHAAGEIVCDIGWTCEAIGNVLKNCMEHTPAGGSITVTASENALYCQVEIADSGSGIAPEDMPYLFDRFYKGKNSGDNSFGIGLSLARSIVSRQNGTLKAENTDTGAKFTFRFYKTVI